MRVVFAHFKPAWFFTQIAPGNVLYHHNKHLMGYFESLHGSRIICFPLNISEKNVLATSLRKTRRDRVSLSSPLLIRYSTHIPWRITSTNQTNESHHHFFISKPILTWPHFGPFFWQNPCSGCNSGIDLVVVLEYTFLQLCFNTEQISLGSQDSEKAM